MPNRILREGILTSERIGMLKTEGGAESELFYRKLMSIVDDYGRIEFSASVLRARLYPFEIDSVTEQDIDIRLGHCLRMELVTFYRSGSKCYLSINDFRQPTRSKSKCPAPEVDKQVNSSAIQMLSDAMPLKAPIERLPNTHTHTQSNTHTHTQSNTNNENERDFEPRWLEYYKRHPGSKTRINDCKIAYLEIIGGALDGSSAGMIADSLNAHQAKWLEYWARADTIPLGLLKFLTGGDCLTDPPEIEEAESESMRGV